MFAAQKNLKKVYNMVGQKSQKGANDIVIFLFI